MACSPAGRLPDGTVWWNTEHRPAPLRGRTPLQAWRDGPTPLRDVPAADLWTFILEGTGTRTLTTRGVRFRKRDYVGAWTTGRGGLQVRVRFMLHRDHPIEVCYAATGRHLATSVPRTRPTKPIGPPGNRSAPYGGHGQPGPSWTVQLTCQAVHAPLEERTRNQ
ncbi:Mu transposase C-terminal domain-containing protein [Streptomyces sp. NPDC127066]|uniref:Mu transposase C-terminal domain-containing protein n=1 Tax=Streptomyces sp. NPDC127066 TaxID=3347125 RepID=UPI00365FB08C